MKRRTVITSIVATLAAVPALASRPEPEDALREMVMEASWDGGKTWKREGRFIIDHATSRVWCMGRRDSHADSHKPHLVREYWTPYLLNRSADSFAKRDLYLWAYTGSGALTPLPV